MFLQNSGKHEKDSAGAGVGEDKSRTASGSFKPTRAEEDVVYKKNSFRERSPTGTPESLGWKNRWGTCERT